VARPRTLLAFAFAAAELGILVGPAPIRVVAGLIVVFMPGLMITRLINLQARMERAEQLLVVLGMSLAVAVITGLVLNSAHIPLTAASWSLALGLITAVGLAAAAALEDEAAGGHPSPRPAASLTALSPGGWRPPGVGPPAMFVMAALAASAAIVIGVLGQRAADSRTQFTELWALPIPGSPPIARLGVRSHERVDVRYRIRVSIDGHLVRSQALALRPGQAWESTQLVRAGQHVDVSLLTSPHGRVYREVHLTAE
jgi:hypothetical protein